MMNLYGFKRTEIYLKRGSKIHFTCDELEFSNTFTFSGDLSNLNNYYVKKTNIKKSFYETGGLDVFLLEEDIFESRLTKYQESMEQLLLASSDIPTDIKDKEFRNIYYERLNQMESYNDTQNNHVPKNYRKNIKLSKIFTNEIEALNLNNYADYLYSANYARLVDFSVNHKAKSLRNKEGISYEKAYFKIISNLKNDFIKEDLLYKNLYDGSILIRNKEIVNTFLSLTKDESRIEKVKKIYENYGKPSPKFVNYESNTGGSFSLEDFKGKFVYIDIWATWCVPCKMQIPYLKKIEEEYHTKNIEFVTISIDKQKDKQKWKDLIIEEEMKGIQLLADNDYNSNFIKSYNIKSIPRFIFLDPKGNIISQSAPRPFDMEKLKDFFDQSGVE